MDANERRARATKEAAQWWGRLGTQAPAEVNEADRLEFTQWLRESPLHVAELLQIAHVHDTLERFKSWGEIPVASEESHDTNINLLSFDSPPLSGSGNRKRLWQRGGAASSWGTPNAKLGGRGTRSLLVVSAAVILIAAGWSALRFKAMTIETDRAERREVMLSDGSVVNLEPETELRVNFGKDQRHVVLLGGRALFHVAKDAARPFIVHVGDTDVRAVGTIFGVEQENQNIIVTVSEGKVAVAPTSQRRSVAVTSSASVSVSESDGIARGGGGTGDSGAGLRDLHFGRGRPKDLPSQSGAFSAKPEKGVGVPADAGNAMASGQPGEVFLTANQQISMRDSGDDMRVQKVDSNRALAWSQGRLVFDSTPLGEVADEFNRYNRVQLRIDGPDLARRTLSGVFQASDPETLIEFVSAGARVVVTRHGDEEIVISAGH